jgi:hypothetical protein
VLPVAYPNLTFIQTKALQPTHAAMVVIEPTLMSQPQPTQGRQGQQHICSALIQVRRPDVDLQIGQSAEAAQLLQCILHTYTPQIPLLYCQPLEVL